jgi:thymidylate synthase (FAD)
MRALLLAHTTIVPSNLAAIGYVMHTMDPVEPADELAEAAGRLCYKSWNRPNPATAHNDGYLAHILEVGHHSILEHATATIYFDQVSRTLTHEFVRHRHLSPSQVSQRYVDETHGKTVYPPDIAGHPYLVQLVDQVDAEARRVYREIVEKLAALGHTRKEARQAARAVLPGGNETAIIMTGNMRAWRHVIAMRNHPLADKEIQELAQAALQICSALAPHSFQDMVEI